MASVKPSSTPGGSNGIRRSPSSVTIDGWSIRQLIMRAYGLWPSQLSAPDWIDSLRFDVSARIPPGANPNQLPGMLQWLLLERFSLSAHSEPKAIQTFALIVAKGGPKMKLAAPVDGPPDDSAALDRLERTGRILDSLWGDASEFGLLPVTPRGSNFHLEFTRMSMDALAQMLSSYLRTPVLDETGLAGRYQASMDFSLADTLAIAQAGDTASSAEPLGTSLFATLQQLGLKLERRKATLPVMVVDHVERVPTAN